jgi:hypothetical protein
MPLIAVYWCHLLDPFLLIINDPLSCITLRHSQPQNAFYIYTQTKNNKFLFYMHDSLKLMQNKHFMLNQRLISSPYILIKS